MRPKEDTPVRARAKTLKEFVESGGKKYKHVLPPGTGTRVHRFPRWERIKAWLNGE